MSDRVTIKTEDGVEVGEGDKVYGFHSQMCVGTMGEIPNGPHDERKDKYHGPYMQGSTDPWFMVEFENGKREMLNGQRVCSVEGAKRLGYIK